MHRQLWWLVALSIGCSTADPGMTSEVGAPASKADVPTIAPDITSTALAIDLGARTGRATLSLRSDGPIRLDAAGLVVSAITREGLPTPFTHRDGFVELSDPAPGGTSVAIDYSFSLRDTSDGALPSGVTLLWPYFCGNLFPCNSAPSDGLRFSLALTGIPEGQRAIFPARIDADAPSYMLAWAVGDYSSRALGATSAGTQVHVHWFQGGEADAVHGTRNLVAVFDWLERNIGAYAFGDEVAAVAARWSGGAYGGMEHHPYWHVAVESMANETTQAHEAAHGWFGNAIRLRCWEDFVLSEGTATYLAARAMGQVAGADKEAEIWSQYSARRRRLSTEVAWPRSCGAVDVLKDGLFSDAPYVRGAFYLRTLAERFGAEVLDEMLASFYMKTRGTAAGMQDLIDHIVRETGDPEVAAIAEAELR